MHQNLISTDDLINDGRLVTQGRVREDLDELGKRLLAEPMALRIVALGVFDGRIALGLLIALREKLQEAARVLDLRLIKGDDSEREGEEDAHDVDVELRANDERSSVW